MDVDQCGDSEYCIPAGTSDTHWDWNVNVPGRIVAIGGHVHTEGHGVRIEATNQTTGQSICNSVATVASGNTVRIHSVYNSPEPMNDVMGIMVAFVGT